MIASLFAAQLSLVIISRLSVISRIRDEGHVRDTESGLLDGLESRVDIWTVLGLFEADSVRKSTLVR